MAIDRIKRVVGSKGWIDSPELMAPYLADWRKRYEGKAALVVRPQSTDELAEVVRSCAAAKLPIVPQGGNTGLCGGATPDQAGDAILVSLSRLNRIRAIDGPNHTITVEAGCVLKQIQETVAEAGYLFPLSLSAEGTCQIGGNLSTNAGGITVLRYGNARDMVLGLEVVLPDGQIWNGLRALRKDNSGYDLKQVFIGAEGTLGIITAAVLKIYPSPTERATGFAALNSLEAAVELLARCRRMTGDATTSFELLPRAGIDMALRFVPGAMEPLKERRDYYVLIELTSSAADAGLRARLEATLSAALDDELIADATIANSDEQARRLWMVRESIVELQKVAGASIKHDIAVPVSVVPAFLSAAFKAVQSALPGIRPIAFGHVGDGNIHFNLYQPENMAAGLFMSQQELLTRVTHNLVIAHGGSISAEHGVGQLRRAEIRRYKPAVEIELMRGIKQAIDPHNIMNPGKVL
ncbi:MAG: FAD-binding oxidoreductase [Dongiaceae bacterium]